MLRPVGDQRRSTSAKSISRQVRITDAFAQLISHLYPYAPGPVPR